MSFVDRYLPYFKQQLITFLLLALLPFQTLFTESSNKNQLLASPPVSGALTAPFPLCCELVFSSLLIQFFFFFLAGWGVSLPRGPCWFIPGEAGEISHDAWCSPIGLLNVSQAGLEPVSGGMAALLFS
jgi:hypothetical protein